MRTIAGYRAVALAALIAGLGGEAIAVSPPPVKASNGMVVTSQRLASDVGAEVLKAGGNAVDAAVAVGYALAVVLPCCGKALIDKHQ